MPRKPGPLKVTIPVRLPPELVKKMDSKTKNRSVYVQKLIEKDVGE